MIASPHAMVRRGMYDAIPHLHKWRIDMAFFTGKNYTMAILDHKWGAEDGKANRVTIWGWNKGQLKTAMRSSDAMVAIDVYNDKHPSQSLELQLTPREARQMAREFMRMADIAEFNGE